MESKIIILSLIEQWDGATDKPVTTGALGTSLAAVNWARCGKSAAGQHVISGARNKHTQTGQQQPRATTKATFYLLLLLLLFNNLKRISNLFATMMHHDSELQTSQALLYCNSGQETVHDIVTKTTELFNHLKATQATLPRSTDSENRKAKIAENLNSVQYKFESLRAHYANVNRICSNLAYVQVKSLIPYKDDPDSVEMIQKHRRNLGPSPDPSSQKEIEELQKKVAEQDEELKVITNELRDFIYEINTMLHVSKI